MGYKKINCIECGQFTEGYKLDKNTNICLKCAEKIIERIIKREQEIKNYRDERRVIWK